MAFILGAVVGVFLLSSLVGVIAFRKVEKPKKHFYSTPIAWMLATVLAGYGMADGGEPKFFVAAINYGIASVILLIIVTVAHYLRRRHKMAKDIRAVKQYISDSPLLSDMLERGVAYETVYSAAMVTLAMPFDNNVERDTFLRNQLSKGEKESAT